MFHVSALQFAPEEIDRRMRLFELEEQPIVQIHQQVAP